MPALATTLRTEFVFTISVEPEDDGPEGHFDTGDDELDAKMCAEIRANMEWNEWAWCCVKVTATHPDIDDIEGTDYLGGSSYRDAADFKAGGYYEQMCDAAAKELEAKIEKVRAVLAKGAR